MGGAGAGAGVGVARQSVFTFFSLGFSHHINKQVIKMAFCRRADDIRTLSLPACADLESFFRGGPILITFFLFS